MSVRRIQPQQRPRGPKGNTGIEWIGGMATLPSYVADEDAAASYRPEVLCWMGSDGMVLGSVMAKPNETVALACESLMHTIAQPMCGTPHRPTRVRVASEALAGALRSGCPDIEVVCAPTPELDEMFALMREHMAEGAATNPSYLWPGTTPQALASFFKAAAACFRATPWNVVPNDHSVFSVTIEQCKLHDAAMIVIGQLGESFGLLLFHDVDGLEAYTDSADAIARGQKAAIPPHFALTFERGADVDAALRKEISAHGWEVADASAYPWISVIEEDFVGRPPSASEITMFEAIARALVAVLADKKTLLQAWRGGEPVSRTLSVASHAGNVEVTLRAPHGALSAGPGQTQDILAALAGLECGEDEPPDHDAREALEAALLRQFVGSPEAKGLEAPHASRLVMELAAHYYGQTIATLRAPALREILFDIIPQKVSIDASEAGMMVQELRAFYTFLKRAFRLSQADACLRALGPGAAKRLEAALSDTSNFGMVKALFMSAAAAGFDMQSKEGVEAFMRSIEGQPLPDSIPLPGLRTPSPSTPKAKKPKKANKGKRKTTPKVRK